MQSRSRTTLRDLIATSGLAIGLAAGVTAACGTSSNPLGSGSGPGQSGSESAGSSGAANSGSLAGSSGASGTPLGGSGTAGDLGGGATGSTSGTAPPTCASQSRKGQIIPVDMFIMMDQSGSMTDVVTGPNGTTGTKWDFFKQAFTSFVQDPSSAGIGVGIQYFPIPNVNNSSCDAGTYAVTNAVGAPPSGVGVGIAPLPGNATAIVTSLNAHTPGGQTPTVPALVGAVEYAKTWAAQNPSHKVVVVFATDGDPNGCTNDTIGTAAGVARAAAAGSPPIPTFVIGIGTSLSSLDQIADAGGTGPALIISTGQDVAAQFLAAMNAIRSSVSIPCVLTIPVSDGGAVDFGKVNVVDSPSDGGAPIALFQVANAAACDPALGGWFYDNAVAPTTISLCPTSCSMVTADLTDQVDIQVGCATLVAPPR